MKRTMLIAAAVAALGSTPPPSAAQVRVMLQQAYPVETMFVSDFSPHSVGQQPGFLAITLQNGAAESQSVVLELEVHQEQPSAARIFRGNTDPFSLDEPMLRLTNRELVSEGSPQQIASFEIGSANVADRIMQSGRFPAGTYLFSVTVSTPQGMVLDRAELRLDLTNVTRLELVTPGEPFGNPPPVVRSPAPRFVWSTDTDIASDEGEYELRVVPVSGEASAEEAMEGFAAWETTTTMTTAVYPGSVSALQLEPGTTYAWQVVRRVQTSGGTESLESPIYWFRMSPTGVGSELGSGAEIAGAQLLERLGRVLGLGDDLEGFEPTGQVTVDGRAVPMQGLEQLLRAILAGDVAVRSVTIRGGGSP